MFYVMIASSLACAKLVFGKTLRNMIQTARYVTANETGHLSGLSDKLHKVTLLHIKQNNIN